MSWKDILKWNPIKALQERKAAKEKAEQEARDKSSREMNEKRQARFASPETTADNAAKDKELEEWFKDSEYSQ